jgi:hypothetical protein
LSIPLVLFLLQVKWFCTICVEISKGNFVQKASGSLCLECGCIVEAFPQDSLEQIAEQYRVNANFKLMFENCRAVMHGSTPRSWRPAMVAESFRVGMSCEVVVYCVEESCIDKWFKLDSKKALLEVGKEKPVNVRSPEGKEVVAYLMKSVDGLPKEIPHFSLRFFAEAATSMEDIFLESDGALHEKQATATHSFLLKENLEQRIIRLAGVQSLPTWGEYQQKVDQGQKGLAIKEQERLRQMELANSGAASETQHGIMTTGSRLRRQEASSSSTLMLPPPPRKGGGRGRGAAMAGRGSGRSLVALTSGQSIGSPAGKSGASARSASSVACDPPPPASPSKTLGGTGLDPSVSEELAKLLVSTHGKPFPPISAIFAGVAIKRELGGVWVSDCFRVSDV